MGLLYPLATACFYGQRSWGFCQLMWFVSAATFNYFCLQTPMKFKYSHSLLTLQCHDLLPQFLVPRLSVRGFQLNVSTDSNYPSGACSMESLNSELSLGHLLTYGWLTYYWFWSGAITVTTTNFLKSPLSQEFMYWHCHIKAEHIFAGFD